MLRIAACPLAAAWLMGAAGAHAQADPAPPADAAPEPDSAPSAAPSAQPGPDLDPIESGDGPEGAAAESAAPASPTPYPPAAAAPGPATGRYLTPGTPPPGLHPPPAQQAEYWRYEVELVPQLGLAWPHCRVGNLSSDSCDGVKLGGYAGFAAFWRLSPYFAWGGALDMIAFRYDPPPELGRDRAGAAAYFLGLVARLYAVEEGSIDPYAQLGLGGAALATAFEEGSGVDEQRYEETGAGPALQLSLGVDFYLSPRLKLGPAVSYTKVFVDKIRRCQDGGAGDCVDVAKSEHGHLDGYATAVARLTILLGDEL
jgi:opacity protein-like surface antigen